MTTSYEVGYLTALTSFHYEVDSANNYDRNTYRTHPVYFHSRSYTESVREVQVNFALNNVQGVGDGSDGRHVLVHKSSLS